jgi:hypothetical protein
MLEGFIQSWVNNLLPKQVYLLLNLQIHRKGLEQIENSKMTPCVKLIPRAATVEVWLCWLQSCTVPVPLTSLHLRILYPSPSSHNPPHSYSHVRKQEVIPLVIPGTEDATSNYLYGLTRQVRRWGGVRGGAWELELATKARE